MPTLTATQIPATTHVRLELDWSDNTDVQYVKLIRLRAGESYSTTTNTGGTAIRLPAWGLTFTDDLGTWTYLSNGRGVWHDTEAPLDEPVSWLAVARVNTTTARDTYTRAVVDGWGSADTGEAYTLSGTAANFDVNGTKGTIQPSATGSPRLAVITDTGGSTNRIVTADLSWAALPATGELRVGIAPLVIVAATDYYLVEMVIVPAGTMTIRVVQVVAGVRTVVASTALRGFGFKYVANAVYRMKVRVDPPVVAGTPVYGKVWPIATMAEPVDWQVTGNAGGLLPPSTDLAMFARNETAVTTHVASFDNMQVQHAVTSTLTVATAGTTTLATNSLLWLKDPLRPGRDRSIDLCPTPGSGCTGPTGIFFQSMSRLDRAADHGVFPVANSPRPATISRLRKAPTGELRLVTRTLNDLDDVLSLVESGTPLLLQAPVAYGMPDRYLQVGDVGEDRIHIDHRVPFRLMTLPWAEVDGPAGPAEGVAETRWDDLCTNYATWALLIAAGWTWTDIMQGDAA